jgi:hypothetical protein
MSIDNPPIYSGITYNSQFFAEDTGGLSETQANALYLRKTFPDTATALETFNSGIQTNAVSPLTGGSLSLGTTNNLVLNVGTGTRSTAVVHHYSDADNAVAGANVHLNNGTSNLSNTIIHSGSSSGGNVYIANGGLSTTQLYIGNQVTGDTTTTMYGNTILTKPQTNTIVGTTASSTINLYNTTTTSNITMGSGQTSGNFILASGTNRTGPTSIASFTKGNILIGDAMMTGGTGLVTIGSSSVGSITLNSGTQLNIGTSGTGQITLGKTAANTTIAGNNTYLRGASTLNIGDNSAVSITIGNIAASTTINNPLTIGYAPTAITADTQIGRTVESVFATNISLSTSGDNSIVTLTIGTAGVFIINFSFRYGGASTAVANCESWFNTSTGGAIQYGNQAYYSNPNAVMGSNVICQAGSAVITTTAVSTITFHTFITYTGGIPILDKTFSYYSYTRLA